MGTKKMSAAEKLNNLRIDDSFGASIALTDAFRPSHNLADALVPSGIRTMLEMQRGIERLISPVQGLGLNFQPDAFASAIGAERLGLGRFAPTDLLRATNLHAQFGEMTQLMEIGNLMAAHGRTAVDRRAHRHAICTVA